MDNSIVVLMSTYNGEKYIKEQLDSIVEQKGVDIKLMIRDDGSTDSTPNIISEFCKMHNNVEFINEGNLENLGFNKSFMTLLAEGLSRAAKCQYFAFADQDDVWFDNKLINAMRCIESRCHSINDNKMIYYYANKYWTDESLKIVHQDNFVYCKDNYFDMFMLPPVYGCTSVISRNLAERALEMLNNDSLLYDVYIYRLTCLLGGTVISEHLPVMYYRRHGKNASGDAMEFSILKMVKKYVKTPDGMHGARSYIQPIYDKYKDEMPDEQRMLCELILGNSKKKFKKIRLVCWKKAHDRGIKASVMWIGRVILNAI